MGQMGNAMEIMEMGFDPKTGELKTVANGGSVQTGLPFNDFASLGIQSDLTMSLTDENSIVGFRVAMIPEPSALSLLAVGLGGLAMFRRRRS
jgi:hypothetical protein